MEPGEPVAVHAGKSGAEQRPDGQEGQERNDQPLEPAGEPGSVPFLAALGGLPAEGVDEAADEEEDWHDLEEPSEPAGPADEGERVAGNYVPVLGKEGDDEPVADDDDTDGGGAQEVDVAVAVGWSLGGPVGGLGPDGEGHFFVVFSRQFLVFSGLLWFRGTPFFVRGGLPRTSSLSAKGR